MVALQESVENWEFLRQKGRPFDKVVKYLIEVEDPTKCDLVRSPTVNQ